MEYEVVVLPEDKYKSFLQGYSIILGVWNHACPKYTE